MARHGGPRGADENHSEKRRPRRACGGGFTLIELLIVVAIASILMSILAATFPNLRGLMWRINCGANQRQLGLAWGKYALEKGRLPVSNTGGTEAWVRMGEFGNTEQSITSGSLWPYVQELSLYRCQGSVYNYYVSYGMSGRLNGEWNSASKLREIADPAGTMLLIEEYDNRGYNVNSFLIDPKSYNWIDVVAGNHDGGDNLTFADGHVEYWQWLDPRTLTFGGGHYASAPGSVDLQRLDKVWNTW